MSKYEIHYKAGGDNPSHYEVEQYRKDISNNQLALRVISSDLAFNCIRAEMQKKSIDFKDYLLFLHESDGTIISCKFIDTAGFIQWAEVDWKQSCSDLHKHCPETSYMKINLELLMELM